jgi:hypothetical protein
MSNRHECEAFSQRLLVALNHAGMDATPTSLMRRYNAASRCKAISVFGVRKWLAGESIPTQEKIQTLAAMLNVSAGWLRFGSGEAGAVSEPPQLTDEEKMLVAAYRQLDSSSQRDFLRSMTGRIPSAD